MFNQVTPLRPYGGNLVNANVSVKGHLQTLIGHFFESPSFSYPTEFVKLRLSGPTENVCGLHISIPSKPVEKVLLLFHGLGGSSESDYIRRTAQLAYEMNWVVIRVDHRGAGHVFGEYTEPYHSGRGEDVSDMLDYSKKRFPGFEHIAFGVSMSGTIILNLLTGRFGETKPDRAIIVNAPLNLHNATENLQKGFSLVYDWRFYLKLKRMILKKEKSIQLPLISHTSTIDDLFTSIKSGYKNRIHYYDECSPFEHLKKITTQTYVLTAADDPIVSYELYKQAQWSETCHVHISQAGGHVGYYSDQEIKVQNKNFGHRWLDYFLFSLFQKISGDNNI